MKDVRPSDRARKLYIINGALYEERDKHPVNINVSSYPCEVDRYTPQDFPYLRAVLVRELRARGDV